VPSTSSWLSISWLPMQGIHGVVAAIGAIMLNQESQ
jgi:hypothetical protein